MWWRKGQQAAHRLRPESRSRGGGHKLRHVASTNAEEIAHGTVPAGHVLSSAAAADGAHQAARLLRGLAPAHNINGQLQRREGQGRGARLSSCTEQD
jgi:hypothetical protein